MWNSFKKEKQQLPEEEKKETLPEIKKEDFVDDSDPSESNVITIRYGTNMPIDLIYSDLKEDHESKGYDDALSNPDTSYKENNVSIIKSNLEVKFKQILLRYEGDLRKVNSHIVSRSDAGLIDLVAELKVQKEILEQHINELKKMETDLQKGELYMTGPFRSYEKGFLRGLAALSLETLKIN